MKHVYNELTADLRIEIQLKEKELNKIKLNYQKIEERFALGEIEKNLYLEYSEKYNFKISEISDNLQDLEKNTSNFDDCIDKALDLSSNIQKAWELGDLKIRKRIQKILFPNGIEYDKKRDIVQTPFVNNVFISMSLLGLLLRREEENGGNLFYKLPPLVTPKVDSSNFLNDLRLISESLE
jgi:hypothetical protein